MSRRSDPVEPAPTANIYNYATKQTGLCGDCINEVRCSRCNKKMPSVVVSNAHEYYEPGWATGTLLWVMLIGAIFGFIFGGLML